MLLNVKLESQPPGDRNPDYLDSLHFSPPKKIERENGSLLLALGLFSGILLLANAYMKSSDQPSVRETNSLANDAADEAIPYGIPPIN